LSCLVGGSIYLFGAIAADYRSALGWSQTQLGIAVGVLFFAGTAVPPIARAIDACAGKCCRRDRWHAALRLSNLMYLLAGPTAAAIIGWAARQQTGVPFAAVALCFGLFGAFVLGTFTNVAHYVTSQAPTAHDSTRVMAALQVMYAVGNMLVPLLWHFGWAGSIPSTYYTNAGLFAVVAALLLLLLRDGQPTSVTEAESTAQVSMQSHQQAPTSRLRSCIPSPWTLLLLLAFVPLFGVGITTSGQFATMLAAAGTDGVASVAPWAAMSAFGAGQLLGRLTCLLWSHCRLRCSVLYLTACFCGLQALAHAIPLIAFNAQTVFACLLLTSLCYGVCWTSFTSACIREHGESRASVDFGTYLAWMQAICAGAAPFAVSVAAGAMYDAQAVTTAAGDSLCTGGACFHGYLILATSAGGTAACAALVYARCRPGGGDAEGAAPESAGAVGVCCDDVAEADHGICDGLAKAVELPRAALE